MEPHLAIWTYMHTYMCTYMRTYIQVFEIFLFVWRTRIVCEVPSFFRECRNDDPELGWTWVNLAYSQILSKLRHAVNGWIMLQVKGIRLELLPGSLRVLQWGQLSYWTYREFGPWINQICPRCRVWLYCCFVYYCWFQHSPCGILEPIEFACHAIGFLRWAAC